MTVPPSATPAQAPNPTALSGRLWPVLKWVLLAILMAFIARRAYQVWVSAPRESIQIDWIWLVLASVAYFVGWLPSVWFWRALLRNLKQPLSISDAVRAYYVGHLGKYVPGKALVLVIRASLVKDQGVNPLLAGMSAGYETLVFMATGAALALAFSPFALGETLWARIPTDLAWLQEYRVLWALAVIAATFATTPLSAWLFTKICSKSVSRQFAESESPPAITAGLICQGVIVMALGWFCHALSLGFVLQSISKQTIDWTQFPLWLASTSLSTVSGFVVLIAPGGVGVREGLLIETLKDQPQIGPQMALIAAGLLRAVWFLTELVAAALLLFAKRFSRSVSKKL